MKLTEKAAYIKGLADGLNYNKESAEGKLIAALIDMVDEMAQTISMLDETVEAVTYVPEMNQYDRLYVQNGLTVLLTAYDNTEKAISLKAVSFTSVLSLPAPRS